MASMAAPVAFRFNFLTLLPSRNADHICVVQEGKKQAGEAKSGHIPAQVLVFRKRAVLIAGNFFI